MARARDHDAVREALPAYDVGEELGRGAFGVVYAARHRQLGREVAVKQLPRAFAADPEVRERFVAEARMVASLDHPHIVPVYDFVDRDDGICLIIMERCRGSLGDQLHGEGLATDEACAAVLAGCAALQAAHDGGLLHRDVKPENLLVDGRGVVKLGDFGIARLLTSDVRRTATGLVIGTPAYMSPEQVRGDDLTPASDVYSVGIMAYELLSGSLPFEGPPTTTALLAHHLVTPPTPLTTTEGRVPAGIGAVIDRSLAKRVDERYGSTRDLGLALAAAGAESFGTGWLRQRRFVLHWPEVVAASERPSDPARRTGTIVVRAEPRVREAPVVSGGTAAVAMPATPPPGAPPPPVGPPTAPPTGPPAGSSAVGRRRGPLVGVAAAVLVVALVGLGWAVLGRDGDADRATGVTTTAPIAEDQETTDTTTDPGGGGFPVPDPPADLDLRDASSPWTPTPCPEEPERVACLYAAVAIDEDGALTAPYLVRGFRPELEPAGYHLHFYLDTAIDGDERRAGAEVPGGSWKLWDGPWPFTSFGGENGRTGFTLADVVAADATRLCVLVADADQEALPGTGNCAPLARTDDQDRFQVQVNRLEGTWVGRAEIGAAMIVPDGWRAVDLVELSPEEAAEVLRPTAVAATTDELEAFVDAGGVLWADGPAEGGGVATVAVSRVPADLAASSTPDEVAAVLDQLGIDTTGWTTARVGTADRVSIPGPDGATTVVVPDHGQALLVRAEAGAGGTATTDAIVATVESS